MITFLLLLVGGINWGLQGALNWDISQLFGGMENIVSRIIFVLIGLSAVYEIATHKKNCKKCNPNEGMKPLAPSAGN
ncbi:MAG: DUF378 domain-containing protein [Parcubacteria group bacterium]|nr:DUF378 domain-containing protein [Parcubacteria group bacterium]